VGSRKSGRNVQQQIHKPKVGGSSPPPATTTFHGLRAPTVRSDQCDSRSTESSAGARCGTAHGRTCAAARRSRSRSGFQV